LLNKKGAQLVGQRLARGSAIVAGVGPVNIGDAFWQVRGPDMEAGTRVVVTAVDSMVLVVERDAG
jgi:membrane protein implicated in regulation of membrane protease activity